MRTVLIVANQTVGGDHLAEAIGARLSGGDCVFHLLVPLTHPVATMAAMGSTAAVMMPATDIEMPNDPKVARERLVFGLTWLAGLGATATGEVVVDPDIAAAVCRTVADRSVDEVIVSTLPTTLSRWLHQDLPHRIERKVSVPVTVVTPNS